MERVRTYCRICEAARGLVAEVEADEITRLLPDEDHPVTRGYACVEGPAMLDVHRDPDRLARPQAREGGRGANVNALAADGPAALEALSGMVRYSGIEVEVRPLASPRD